MIFNHYFWEWKGDARIIILTNIKNYQLLDNVQHDIQFLQMNQMCQPCHPQFANTSRIHGMLKAFIIVLLGLVLMTGGIQFKSKSSDK
jgi:hypothetical protein